MPTVNHHYHSGEQPDVRITTTPGQSIAIDFDGVRIWFATVAQCREAVRQAHAGLLLLELEAEVAS
jgi:hypothetical protein